MSNIVPLIGIVSYRMKHKEERYVTYAVDQPYVNAVASAGGMPVIIPVDMPLDRLSQLRNRLDAVMFTGGPDVDPDRFGGVHHPAVYGLDAMRDELEIQLVRLAAESGWPFLGICRGIQVINVALGGTLYTDIHDQVPGSLRHDNYPDIPRDFLAHNVRVESESRLAKILDADVVDVNSLHHQVIQKTAPSLKALAFSPENLVEAVELPGHPFGLGVQWHPESLQHMKPHRDIFHAFVESASGLTR